jgi:hypothetical protein
MFGIVLDTSDANTSSRSPGTKFQCIVVVVGGKSVCVFWKREGGVCTSEDLEQPIRGQDAAEGEKRSWGEAMRRNRGGKGARRGECRLEGDVSSPFCER